VLSSAQLHGVERFVLISTDKAVQPTSVMGATKRVAELIVQQAALRTGCCYVAVRFGNVLASRGSVVPYMQRQIAEGGPVTVTHPDMRRYFMTIPEAVQLVLQAAALGCGGEIFALDMGQPVRIVDLAHDLIRLSGLEPGRDIEVIFTGLRPGEKLFEEIFAGAEAHERTEHEKIFVCRNGASSAHVPSDLDEVLDDLVLAAVDADPARVRGLLKELVPEYNPPEPAYSLGPAVPALPIDAVRGV
jgi:FlaA1/EpsC-like NDP-sugar epimerase